MFYNVDPKQSAKIMLPQFWFILTTVAIHYPDRPNEVTRKKYYQLIQNLPIYFPHAPLGTNLIELLDLYPVTPYLNSRINLLRWVHFMRNKICPPAPDEKSTFVDYLENYYRNFIVSEVKENARRRGVLKWVRFAVIGGVIGLAVHMYRRSV